MPYILQFSKRLIKNWCWIFQMFFKNNWCNHTISLGFIDFFIEKGRGKEIEMLMRVKHWLIGCLLHTRYWGWSLNPGRCPDSNWTCNLMVYGQRSTNWVTLTRLWLYYLLPLNSNVVNIILIHISKFNSPCLFNKNTFLIKIYLLIFADS